MTKSVERKGKTVEEAVKTACDEFNIPKEKLKYDIISYGASGIFGLVGVKKAKIRIYLQDQQKKGKALPAAPEKKDLAAKEPDNPETTPRQETKEVPEEVEPAVETPPVAPTPAQPVGEPSENREEAATPDQEAAQPGIELLERITAYIADQQEIETAFEEGAIKFQILGDNAGILIGKKGQTLDAIQYLVEKIINKKSEQRIRVTVDIEGYMENRISRLEGMALKMAAKAKKIAKPVTIGQMNAQERKIVHLALKNDPNVRTQSMGDGYLRKIVVFPKGYSRKKRKENRDTGKNNRNG
jgi:spoIIIJ-associated protein